jgi:hypothetical protein
MSAGEWFALAVLGAIAVDVGLGLFQMRKASTARPSADQKSGAANDRK